MSYTRLNIFLLAIFLGSIALSWLLTPNFGRLNPDPMVDMAVSIPYDSFSANGNFKTAAMPLGMTLQELASGTIVYGRIPMHFSPATAAAILAGERLTNPFSATDSAALERGGAVFTNFCFPCHGPMAKGDGPVTTRGFPPPPSIVTGKYPAYKDGQIFHIITYGMNNMPSYAKQKFPCREAEKPASGQTHPAGLLA